MGASHPLSFGSAADQALSGMGGFTEPSHKLHLSIMCSAGREAILGRMTPSRFTMPIREEPQFLVLRWLTIAVLALFVPSACWSGYRAIVQVKSLAIRASGTALGPGTRVAIDGVSWARNYVTMRLMLAQDGRTDTLIVHEIGTHGVPSLDPRWQAESDSAVLSAERLARYHDGEATLVATAVGRSQWLRVPPPTVRVLRVTLSTGAQQQPR
jgi:hypothetical protein